MTRLLKKGPFILSAPLTLRKPIQHKESKWCMNDLLKYVVFLHYFYERRQLQSCLQEMKWSFFRFASVFIQSKNPNQCRILHLNMIRKYGNVTEIVNCFKAKNSNFQEQCLRYEVYIKNIINLIAQQRKSTRKYIFSSVQIKQHQSLEMIEEVTSTVEATSQKKEEIKATDLDYPSQDEKNFTSSTVVHEFWSQCHQKLMHYITNLGSLGNSSMM